MKKFYENLKIERRHSLMPSLFLKNKKMDEALEKLKKISY